MKITSPVRHWHFVVHPSARVEGCWQLTSFEGDIPTGHTEWRTREDAIASATGHFVRNSPPVGDKSFSASPAEDTVTVGTWQLEELLKYADYAEVALRTGFHPPDFIFEPADRSLRQCIDAIKEQRDSWFARRAA